MISFEKFFRATKTVGPWLFLCAIYFCIQLIYIFHLPLMHDEFQQAYSSYEVLHRTPYADYKPYKTVLGYYAHASILKMGLVIFQGNNWQALMLLKIAIAFFNALMLYAICMLVSRVFIKKAVIFSAAGFILFSNILEHGTAIRMDMMTAWFGFLGLALAINRYFFLAGIISGFSFLASQKGIYYNISLIFSVAIMLFLSDGLTRHVLRQMMKLVAACLSPIAAYYFFWFLVGNNPGAVNSVISGSLIAYNKGNFYFLEPYWQQMLERNIGNFMLAIGGLAVLIQKKLSNRIDPSRNLLLMYVLLMTLMVLIDKNTWPYFFVLYIPLLIFVTPILCEYAFQASNKIPTIFIGVCFLVIFLQWAERMTIISSKNNHYQREMVSLMQNLVGSTTENKNQYTYIAGFRALLEAKHAEANYFGWLDKRGYIRLLTADPEPILLALQKNPPMVILRSTKTIFPPRIAEYFASHYYNLCGSLETYILRHEKDVAFLSVPATGYYRIFNKSKDEDIKKSGAMETLFLHVGERIYDQEIDLQFVGSVRPIDNDSNCIMKNFLEDNYEF